MLKLSVLAAQIKPKKGDYCANLAMVGEIFRQIRDSSIDADVLTLPEAAMSGYFLEGGVHDVARTKEELFAELNREYLEHGPAKPMDIVVGFYEQWDRKFYNSCLYATLGVGTGIDASGIVHIHRKFFLPTYGVFDEKRFVSRGRTIDAFPTRFGGVKASTLICEDAWHSITPTLAALKGAQILYIVSASPARGFGEMLIGNVAQWKQLVYNIAAEHNIWVVQTGLVGFEGGKGFVGCSLVVDPFAVTRLEGPIGKEALLRAEIDLDDVSVARANSPMLADLEASLADIRLEIDSIERDGHSGKGPTDA
jgi:predicted amidohydrolase